MNTQNTARAIADIHTPLLRNQWYVAGYADEFDEGLHERTFLNRSIVIYRKENGELVGLQNRCAHRSFPLANGIREGDHIRCRYHGAKYNERGEIIEVPSMDNCPRVSIRHYRMQISGPLAWIWMGEEQAETELPPTPWLGEGWVYTTGGYSLEGNWLLMAENLMDLTHIPFLHAATFDFPRKFAEVPVKLERREESLTYSRENPPNYHRTGFMREETSDELEAAGFECRSAVDFVSPALTVGGGQFDVTDTSKASQAVYMWRVAHFTTPESRNRTHYWYFHSRNYSLQDTALTERIRNMVVDGFLEDKFAIEKIQAMFERDQHPFSEIQFRSDAPGISMRRIVAALSARELEGGERDQLTD